MTTPRPTWWSCFRNIGDVQVVHVDLSENLEREVVAFQTLDRQEQERIQRFVSKDARRRYVLCRSALRFKLCEFMKCENSQLSFTPSSQDKPTALVDLEPVSFNFNVSHSDVHGLLAFSRRGRVGVDVEHRSFRHDIDGEIRKVFSEKEQTLLAAAKGESKKDLFFRLWTIKESLIKATGDGFRLDTASFSVPEALIRGSSHARFQFPHLPELDWEIVNLETNQFAAAMAREVPRD